MVVRGVAQLASAPRLGRGGRRFESFHPDQIKNVSKAGVFYLVETRVLVLRQKFCEAKGRSREGRGAIFYDQ